MRCSCEQAKQESRREALEEAAVHLDGCAARAKMWASAFGDHAGGGGLLSDIAEDIRALKDKPETK